MSYEHDHIARLTPDERRRRFAEIASRPMPAQFQTEAARASSTSRIGLGGKIALAGVLALLGVATVSTIVDLRASKPTAQQPPGPAPITQTATAAPTPQRVPASQASADPDVRANGGLDYLSLKAEAEEKLDGVLTDDHGVRYRDVNTKLSTLEGGGIVAFCGEENSRTPLGGYGGFQRFIASRSVATVESQMEPAEFAQAWDQFCENAVEGPRVWF